MKKKAIQTKFIDRLYKKFMDDEYYDKYTLRIIFGKNKPSEIVILNESGNIFLSVIDENKNLNQLSEEILESLSLNEVFRESVTKNPIKDIKPTTLSNGEKGVTITFDILNK